MKELRLNVDNIYVDSEEESCTKGSDTSASIETDNKTRKKSLLTFNISQNEKLYPKNLNLDKNDFSQWSKYKEECLIE